MPWEGLPTPEQVGIEGHVSLFEFVMSTYKDIYYKFSILWLKVNQQLEFSEFGTGSIAVCQGI